MLYLLAYCISIVQKCDIAITVSYHAMSLSILYQYTITQKSDMSVTVIYHAISLSMLYQCHSEE